MDPFSETNGAGVSGWRASTLLLALISREKFMETYVVSANHGLAALACFYLSSCFKRSGSSNSLPYHLWLLPFGR